MIRYGWQNLGLTVLGLFFIFFAEGASAATLFFSPASGQYPIGKNFNVNILVASDSSVNAMSGEINFSPDKLEIMDLNTSGSIINFWAQAPTFSNTGGKVNFEGIILNPAYKGKAGKILTLTFRAKAEGTAALTYSGASVLANDGQGTNVLTGLGRSDLTILPTVSVKTKIPAAVIKPKPSPNETPSVPAPTVNVELEAPGPATNFQPVKDETRLQRQPTSNDDNNIVKGPIWFYVLGVLFVASILGFLAVLYSWWQARRTQSRPLLMHAQLKSKMARLALKKFLTRDREKLAQLEKELARAEMTAEKDLAEWRRAR